jgi:flagellar hook assembly protein FlgD
MKTKTIVAFTACMCLLNINDSISQFTLNKNIYPASLSTNTGVYADINAFNLNNVAKNIKVQRSFISYFGENTENISFTLQQSQKVSLHIFDMSGGLIKKLTDETMQAGSHQLIWNARDDNESTVPSGMYLLKLQAGNNIETKKLSVLR